MKSDSPQSLEFPDETKGHFQNQGSYDDGRNQFYGLAIGAMAVAASYAARPTSGGKTERTLSNQGVFYRMGL